MNRVNIFLSLILSGLLAGCASQNFQEDISPTLNDQRGVTLEEVPGPVVEMFMAVKIEGDIDPEGFRIQHGPAFGLLGYQVCRSRKGTHELWTIPQISQEDFVSILMTIFPGWVPLEGQTQSNGNGGYQSYAVYQSNSSSSGSGSENNTNFIPPELQGSIIIEYNGICN